MWQQVASPVKSSPIAVCILSNKDGQETKLLSEKEFRLKNLDRTTALVAGPIQPVLLCH
jgi:hypothetical protein